MSGEISLVPSMVTKLECNICMMQFDHTDLIPKVMSCGHTFCIVCIRKLCEIDKVLCPQCRQATPVNSKQIDKLPTNFGLLDLLRTCQKCGGSPCVSDRCSHCNARLCELCYRKHVKALQDELKLKLQKLQEQGNEMTELINSGAFEIDIEGRAFDDLNTVNDNIRKMREDIDRAQILIQEKVIKEKDETLKCYKEWKSSNQKQLESMNDFIHFSMSKINEKALKSLDLLKISKDLDKFNARLDGILVDKPEWKRNVGNEVSVMSLLLAANQQNKRSPSVERNIERRSSIVSNISDEHKVLHKRIPRLDAASADIIGAGKFSGPWAVKESKHSGTICVTDQNNHQVHFISHKKGKWYLLATYGRDVGTFNRPRGLAFDDDNNLYVCDSGNNRFQVMDGNRHLLYTFGSYGKEPGMFDEPRGIFIDDKNKLFICDGANYRVQVFDKRGNFIRLFGCKGSLLGQFQSQPYEVATDPASSNIFVSEYCGHVTIFSYAGEAVKRLQGNSIFFGRARGLSFHDDCLYVSDQERSSIVVLCPNEEKVLMKFEMPGQNPINLSWTASGNLMVAFWTPTSAVKLFKLP